MIDFKHKHSNKIRVDFGQFQHAWPFIYRLKMTPWSCSWYDMHGWILQYSQFDKINIYIYLYIYIFPQMWLQYIYITRGLMAKQAPLHKKLSIYYVRSGGKKKAGVECHHMSSIYIINAKISPVFTNIYWIPGKIWVSWALWRPPWKTTKPVRAHLGPKGFHMAFKSWKSAQ